MEKNHSPNIIFDFNLEINRRFLLQREYQESKTNVQPLVSICVQTYQHENYIADCLDGILMQKTNFPFEIILGEDDSQDNTRQICIEYADKYPERIRLYLRDRKLTQLKDQHGKLIRRLNGIFTRKSAGGKYIAMCEGDDYWTDPLKLQKQVDFLEANESYSLCVSGYLKYNVYTNEAESIITIPPNVVKGAEGYTFTLEHTKENWLTKTLTALFRNDKEILEKTYNYKYGRDINLYYHMLKSGKGFYFTTEMGTYRIHKGGINSMKQGKVNTVAAYNVYRELYNVNKDEWTRSKSLKSTLHYFNFNLYEGSGENSFKENANLYFQAIKLVRNFTDIKLLFTNLLSPSFKLKLKK